MKSSKHGEKINWYDFVVINNQWGRESAESNSSYQHISKAKNYPLTFSYKWDGKPDLIKSFPAICSGWHFGEPGGWLTKKDENKLPFKITSKKNVNVSASVTHYNKGISKEIINLSWDIWLANNLNPDIPGGEIMVWPWEVNQKPIGKLISVVSYWGYKWEVYLGKYKKNDWFVASFICKTPTLKINGNLMDFIEYCLLNKFFDSNYYILGIEFGNEILLGEGTFEYKFYELNFE